MQRVGFGFGALAGMALAPGFFAWSLVRGARAVHARGPVLRGELNALDATFGPRLAGPALVRLSGALAADGAPDTDVLGMAIRAGGQDLVLGTFERFLHLRRDSLATDVGDYLANVYHSVTPYRAAGLGVIQLHAEPAPSAHRTRAGADDRRARLAADVAAGRARFTLRAGATPIAELRLLELLPDEAGRDLRISMFRCEAGLHPTGFRSGIRAVVYPVSQTARRLTGG